MFKQKNELKYMHFERLSSKHEMVEPIDSQRTEGGSEEKFDSQRTEEEMPRVDSTSHVSTTFEAKNSDRRDFRINHDLQGPKIKNQRILRCAWGLPLIQEDKDDPCLPQRTRNICFLCGQK